MLATVLTAIATLQMMSGCENDVPIGAVIEIF
jgi:hypothetical protein